MLVLLFVSSTRPARHGLAKVTGTRQCCLELTPGFAALGTLNSVATAPGQRVTSHCAMCAQIFEPLNRSALETVLTECSFKVPELQVVQAVLHWCRKSSWVQSTYGSVDIAPRELVRPRCCCLQLHGSNGPHVCTCASHLRLLQCISMVRCVCCWCSVWVLTQWCERALTAPRTSGAICMAVVHLLASFFGA